MRGRRPVWNQDDDSFAAATEEAFLDGLQDLVHSGVDIQHLIIFGTLNVCELVKTSSLTKQFQHLRHICMWINIETLDILTKGSITSVCQENQKFWRRLYLLAKGNITPPYMIEITCVWWYVFSMYITEVHTQFVKAMNDVKVIPYLFVLLEYLTGCIKSILWDKLLYKIYITTLFFQLF